MSYNPSRALPSHLRSASLSNNTGTTSTSQSPLLLQRIHEKKAELANLRELQELSKGLADQMAMLETKLATLSDGTEAVATVLANWHNVLRAIGMASSKFALVGKDGGGEKAGEVPLPQTLVRIPTQSAGMIAQAAEQESGD
ncbi:hypothetical protein EJ08DRAFT_597500 [Tothia fuscella]|uniref:DASH complex subunit DAD2 n=1 Tax=Tothia fuscella TaxID=1048955 RepID=A0A9P4NH41_9PEZI|nr:hypothetical protein EJ08DRAFT_597500 [Tothia fuscella]